VQGASFYNIIKCEITQQKLPAMMESFKPIKMKNCCRMQIGIQCCESLNCCGFDVFSFRSFFFFLCSPRFICGTEDWTVMCSLLNLGSFCHRGLVEVRVYFGCGLRQKKKSIVADNVYVDVGSRSMGCWISAEYFTSAPMYFVSAPQKT